MNEEVFVTLFAVT